MIVVMILNVPLVLNMPGLWIYQNSEYAKVYIGPWISVQIVALHFTNCKMNSRYSSFKFYIIPKMWSSSFQRKIYFIHIIFPDYVHILSIRRNIAYTQNYISKYKKCLEILKENCLQWAKSLTIPWLRLAYLLWKDKW